MPGTVGRVGSAVVLLVIISAAVLLGLRERTSASPGGGTGAQPGTAIAGRGGTGPTAPARPTVTTASRTQTTSSSSTSRLPTIPLAQLPPEAKETIHLIAQGGPFPYTQDGTVFGNREGLLPPQPMGYYHEYTVVTPGAPDRGARRIIAGRDGELYYTDDHYNSFKRVQR